MDRDAARKREAGFLSREGDAAAVYRFDTGAMADSPVPLEQARSTGESPIISGYDLIATGPIMRGADALAILEEYRANGFARPGDVVSFKQDGAVTCWYVDQLAFSKLPGLLENHLKTAELGMEQNCNQIDGIINNTAPKFNELATEDEALFLVGGTTYLHVQTSDSDRDYTHDDCYATYDYTLYDRETMRQLDGGRMEIVSDIRDDPHQVHLLAARNILECRTDLGGAPLEPVSIDLLEILQDAAMREMEARVAAIKASKPSRQGSLKQCQQEVADRAQGSGSPGRHGPEKGR